MIFKRITIDLSGPICPCQKYNLTWNLVANSEGKIQLHVACDTCGIALIIPEDKFDVGFRMEQPYPDQETKKSEILN